MPTDYAALIADFDNWLKHFHCTDETAELLRRVRTALWESQEECINQRVVGHGEGQEHTIADVNAGRIDDLIAPRLREAEA